MAVWDKDWVKIELNGSTTPYADWEDAIKGSFQNQRSNGSLRTFGVLASITRAPLIAALEKNFYQAQKVKEDNQGSEKETIEGLNVKQEKVSRNLSDALRATRFQSLSRFVSFIEQIGEDRNSEANSEAIDEIRAQSSLASKSESSDGTDKETDDISNLFARIPIPERVPAFSESLREGIVPGQPIEINNDVRNGWIDQDYLQGADVTKKTVIVGVIDRGIALGHRSSTQNDKTRILAAWTQGTSPGADLKSPLGVGREVTFKDINRLLKDCKRADGSIDEDRLNRESGTYNPLDVKGDRGQARRASHGAHMFDIAAGYDPENRETETQRENIRAIAVNMPGNGIIGPAGQYLEAYAAMAVLRIVDLADHLWDLKFDGETHETAKKKGFPIVINLSFAKLAGARDGNDFFSQLIQSLNKERGRTRPKITLVTPAGNQNLARGNASTQFTKTGQKFDLHWIVPGCDQSANFTEIWAYPDDNGTDKISVPQIRVTAPDGTTHDLNAPDQDSSLTLRENKDPIARIYALVDQFEKPKRVSAVQFLIATKQTELYEEASPVVAPSGNWKIELVSTSDDSTLIWANVQTDDTGGASRANRFSYFHDDSYSRFEALNQRPADFTKYDRDSGNLVGRNDCAHSDSNEFDTRTGVRRRGSINAIAQTTRDVRVAAGYNAADGRPALYSGTGDYNASRLDSARGGVSAGFPTDDGYAHPGVLAAGSTDGSVVSLRGTSSASAQLTRLLSQWLLEKKSISRAIKSAPRIKNPSVKAIAKLGNGAIKPTALPNGSARVKRFEKF